MFLCDKELECKTKDKRDMGEALDERTSAAAVLQKFQCKMCSSAVVDLAAGCAGGAAAILVGQPLDTVKVKLQTSPELHQRGMVNCFRKVTGCCRLIYNIQSGVYNILICFSVRAAGACRGRLYLQLRPI